MFEIWKPYWRNKFKSAEDKKIAKPVDLTETYGKLS